MTRLGQVEVPAAILDYCAASWFSPETSMDKYLFFYDGNGDVVWLLNQLARLAAEGLEVRAMGEYRSGWPVWEGEGVIVSARMVLI